MGTVGTQAARGGQGCPKSEGFISPPCPHRHRHVYPSPSLGGTEADTPSEDKKRSPLDSAGPSSNLFIPQANIKCLHCAWMMGLLGKLSLQVKGDSHGVPDPTPDQDGPEGEERGSKRPCWSSCPAPSPW